jgi:hypothetical protein
MPRPAKVMMERIAFKRPSQNMAALLCWGFKGVYVPR